MYFEGDRDGQRGGGYGGDRGSGGGGYGGGGRGDTAGYGRNSDDKVTQEDTIFVSGMPDQANEDDIKDHFGSIGIIKVC